jgi:hypothetical protein
MGTRLTNQGCQQQAGDFSWFGFRAEPPIVSVFRSCIERCVRGFAVLGLGLLFVIISVPLSGQSPPFRTKRPIEFHLAEEQQGPSLIPIHVKGEARIIYLWPQVEFDDRDIRTAAVLKDAAGQPAVQVHLRPSGVKKFNALVQTHYHKLLAIAVNDRVVSAPTIEGGLVDDLLDITGAFTPAEAAVLAEALSK